MRKPGKRFRAVYSALFSPWVMGGAFIVAFFLCFLTFSLFWFTRRPKQPNEPATAILHVTSAPTATLSPLTPTPLISPTSTSLVPPSPPPGAISIGSFVQISGTGGDGLRLRIEPGLNSQVRLLGSEAEVLRVDEGPIELDGYTWWYLVGPFDETRHGWAVSNFLIVVENP